MPKSELRISYGSMMKRIVFPRDRKRDSLFGGMRKKALQELKEQQLALYVENVRPKAIYRPGTSSLFTDSPPSVFGPSRCFKSLSCRLTPF